MSLSEMSTIMPQPQDVVDSGSPNPCCHKAADRHVLHGRAEESSDTWADDLLGQFGYESQLQRNRSTAHVAFMAFVLAANPYGLATTLNYPLIGGGPVNIIWGWLLVAMIVVCVALSLGEITSVFPTAGGIIQVHLPLSSLVPCRVTDGLSLISGVYYQSAVLTPLRYRPLASWICGWLFMVGNISISLSVNFGTAQFLAACLDVFESEPGVGVFPHETYQIFMIFVAITLLCNAVSCFGNRWLPLIDVSFMRSLSFWHVDRRLMPPIKTAAIFWTIAGILAIAVSVITVAKSGRHTAGYVFGHFETESGWPYGWSFCIGLMHAGYATSSTGMIIS